MPLFESLTGLVTVSQSIVPVQSIADESLVTSACPYVQQKRYSRDECSQPLSSAQDIVFVVPTRYESRNGVVFGAGVTGRRSDIAASGDNVGVIFGSGLTDNLKKRSDSSHKSSSSGAGVVFGSGLTDTRKTYDVSRSRLSFF